MTAAVKGARGVAMPVIFSVLTNVVAFMPLCFIPGFAGKIFGMIPLVVVSVFLISLLESLFILPAHLGRLKVNGKTGMLGGIGRLQVRFSNGFNRAVAKYYGRLLKRIIENRYTVLAAGVAVFGVTLCYLASGRMGITLMEKVESDFAQATATLPYGTAVSKTAALNDILVNAAKEAALENGGDALLKGVVAEIGSSGSNSCTVLVFLTGPDERPISTQRFVQAWRNKVGEIPGLESLVFESDFGGPGGGADLTIELTHKDLDVLEAAGQGLAESLTAFPDLNNINDGFKEGKKQFDFNMLPHGRRLGLTARSVANQVRGAFYGAEVVRQQRGRNEITISVCLPEIERNSAFHLEELMLMIPNGGQVPLRDVVSISPGRAYTTIQRGEGRRVIKVTANVQPVDQTQQIMKTLNTSILPELAAAHPGLSYSFGGKQAMLQEGIHSLILGLIMALLIIYTLLAVPFRSYVQPMIIMAGIPFSFVGAVLGHLVMGYN